VRSRNHHIARITTSRFCRQLMLRFLSSKLQTQFRYESWKLNTNMDFSKRYILVFCASFLVEISAIQSGKLKIL
jgi:hypothetical protein